jgi:hypothetical protein
MDDVIYEEFKGTGNSELILDRKLAEKRIFPAIDVMRSGTRREELLLEEPTLKMVWTMRRMLSAVGTNEGIELLLNRLAKTETNTQFLAGLTKSLDSSREAEPSLGRGPARRAQGPLGRRTDRRITPTVEPHVPSSGRPSSRPGNPGPLGGLRARSRA